MAEHVAGSAASVKKASETGSIEMLCENCMRAHIQRRTGKGRVMHICGSRRGEKRKAEEDLEAIRSAARNPDAWSAMAAEAHRLQHRRRPWFGSRCLESLLREVHARGCGCEVHRRFAPLCAVSLSPPPSYGHRSLEAGAMLRSGCRQVPLDTASFEAFVLPRLPAACKALRDKVCSAEGPTAMQIALLRAAGVAISQVPRNAGAQGLLHAPSGREANHHGRAWRIEVRRWLQFPWHAKAEVESHAGEFAPSFFLHLTIVGLDF